MIPVIVLKKLTFVCSEDVDSSPESEVPDRKEDEGLVTKL